MIARVKNILDFDRFEYQLEKGDIIVVSDGRGNEWNITIDNDIIEISAVGKNKGLVIYPRASNVIKIL